MAITGRMWVVSQNSPVSLGGFEPGTWRLAMTMRTTEARPNVPSDEGKEREKFLQEMENGDRRSACSEKQRGGS